MDTARRRNRWRFAVSAGMLVLAINVTGCSTIGGLMPGAASDTSGSGDATGTGRTSASAGVAASPVPKPATNAAPRPGVNQPVAARVGSIAETLSLVGRVAAAEEVQLGFNEKLAIKSVAVKVGQTVDADQVLVIADATDIQTSLDAAQRRLEADTASLAQAQAAGAAQQQAAARQAAAAQQAQADRVAAAQANLNTARAALQKVQAGASAADLQAAQNAVAAAQVAAHKAQADQTKVEAGPDAAQVRAAEQELANAQAAFSKAQADLAKMPGGQVPDDTSSGPNTTAAPTPAAAENISPQGVSTDPSNPANNFGFQGIAVDPAHSGTVYVGTCYQGLWRTTDGGHTWAKVNTGANGKALDSGRLWLVVVDPTDGQVIYAAPGYGVGGLWKSTDAGVNWTPLFPAKSPVVQQLGIAPTPSNLSIDPANHLHMIASSHFPWAANYTGVGVLETNDGGNTWTIHDPIPNSGAEHTVGLIDSTTWLESFAGGTYRTTDAGGTWTKVTSNTTVPENMTAINGVLYLPSPTGMMRSTDKGATWQGVGTGGMVAVSDGTNLFTQESGPGGGHQAPLYYSPVTDGMNWSEYSSQSMCTSGACDGPAWAAYDAGSHTIYFSNWIAGVWKLQTGGTSSGAAAPAPVAIGKVGPLSQSDVVSARQRLQSAKDAVDAARAKLQALRDGPDQDTLDSARLGAASADAALEAAQAHLDSLRRGPAPADLRAAQDAVTVAQAALDRARSNVDEGPDLNPTDGGLEARQKAIDKDNADITRLQDRLAATRLTAPFAGTVVTVRVKVGDTADDTHPVISLAKPGVPLLRATVTPSDFDNVRLGQVAMIQLPGQPDAAAVSGRVNLLTSNDAGTAKIATVEVDWSGDPPKLGAVMNVGLVLHQKDAALLVPKKAVHSTGTRSFVELLDGTSRKVTTVQVGLVGNYDAEIVSGLTQGQLVVVGP